MIATQTTAIANSPAEARQLITGSVARVVELEFKCTPSLFSEIAVDSRKYGVSVVYREQEMILVESFRALKRGLFAPKDTFRQRFLVCCFDMSSEAPEEIAAVEARAAELGDMLLPEQAVSSPYSQWSN
jgi:hypothetical protein